MTPQAHHFSTEGARRYYQELHEAEQDPDLIDYHLGQYLEAARESWQYATDEAFRTFIEEQAIPAQAAVEAAAAARTAAQLELDMTLDEGYALVIAHIKARFNIMAAAYLAGDRAPELYTTFQKVMEVAHMANYEPTAEDLPGLAEEDIRHLLDWKPGT